MESVSVVFPVYNDEATVRVVAEKAMRLLEGVGFPHEIIIVDDGSPDAAGRIADSLAREKSCIRVIHHERNLGYGAAVRSGLAAARHEYVCQTDGDDEYDVEDLQKLLRLRSYYDLVITFRYKKLYSGWRITVSWFYNRLLRFLFRTPFRDVSTGLRMVRREVLEDVVLRSCSPFIGAELAIKTMLKGYRIGEVGIQTFPREFGRGRSVSFPNIVATIRDMWRTYLEVFSDTYDLPASRSRNTVQNGPS
jgi:glycosyltransferase involved in cell wall biosynthesis